MKPLVRQSLEDPSGARCVDVFELPDGFGWVECRRDPEDGHGWRHIDSGTGPAFPSLDDALKDARRSVGWLTGSS